jgi:hypothetical protein
LFAELISIFLMYFHFDRLVRFRNFRSRCKSTAVTNGTVKQLDIHPKVAHVRQVEQALANGVLQPSK